MSERRIYLVGGDDDESATVRYVPKGDKCHITFRYRDRVIEASAYDYFEAFCLVRARLEDEHLIPFCYGASLNVYPSGMCRDMGAGMKAYRMTIGKHVDPKKDLVAIFDQGPDVIPATISRQRQHFEEWLRTKKA
jgi:hypothetical protein